MIIVILAAVLTTLGALGGAAVAAELEDRRRRADASMDRIAEKLADIEATLVRINTITRSNADTCRPGHRR